MLCTQVRTASSARSSAGSITAGLRIPWSQSSPASTASAVAFVANNGGFVPCSGAFCHAIVVGLCFPLHRAFNNPPKSHGVEDVGGVAGIDDADVVAGVNYAGKGTRRRPWCSLSSLEPSFPVVMGSNCCSPLNGKPLAFVESSGQVDDAAHVEGARWSPTCQLSQWNQRGEPLGLTDTVISIG